MKILKREDIVSGSNERRKKDESLSQYLARLTHVRLDHRQAVDCEPELLQQCTILRTVYLYDNKLSRLPLFQYASQTLKELYLQNNELKDLSFLEASGLLPNLIILHLRGNKIARARYLNNVPALKELHIEEQRLEKEEALLFDESIQSCQELEILDARSNNINDIENLAGLASVKTVLLGENRIEDLKHVRKVVSQLPQLEELSLIGNPVVHHPKYRPYLTLATTALHTLDGKLIHDVERQFLLNWEQKRRENNSMLKSLSSVIQVQAPNVGTTARTLAGKPVLYSATNRGTTLPNSITTVATDAASISFGDSFDTLNLNTTPWMPKAKSLGQRSTLSLRSTLHRSTTERYEPAL